MATVNYSDRATLKNSNVFQDRITVAVAKYVQFILGNNAATVSQSNWARNVFQSSGFVAEGNRVMYFAIWDATVTALTSPVDQTAISDASLQTIVETAINNSIIPKFGF